ncbi:MAG: preprotein translocase subunit SecG [Clostridia bacterium]
MQIALTVILIVCSLALIVSVLMQSGTSAGLGAVGGGADQFFGKGKKLDDLFSKITTASAVGFMICTLLLTITQ